MVASPAKRLRFGRISGLLLSFVPSAIEALIARHVNPLKHGKPQKIPGGNPRLRIPDRLVAVAGLFEFPENGKGTFQP
ncbi:hypothetical protein IWX85_002738 [Polaromonas sp. CG_9.11]|nr:hypothetical protein [Polaromonas sp. CG_9.11]